LLAAIFLTAYGNLIALRVIASNVSALWYVRRIDKTRTSLMTTDRLRAILPAPAREWPPPNQFFWLDLHMLCGLIISVALAVAASISDGLLHDEWTFSGVQRGIVGVAILGLSLAAHALFYECKRAAYFDQEERRDRPAGDEANSSRRAGLLDRLMSACRTRRPVHRAPDGGPPRTDPTSAPNRSGPAPVTPEG
jgi:hypothetical protein